MQDFKRFTTTRRKKLMKSSSFKQDFHLFSLQFSLKTNKA